MIEITEEMIADAKVTIASGNPQAAGYRVMLHAIGSTDELEAAQMKDFPTLAAADFVKSSADQTERETRGTHFGIIVHVGRDAFKGKHLTGVPWVEVGETVIFDRYAGVDIELPPGSGNKFKFCNDESIIGKFERKS